LGLFAPAARQADSIILLPVAQFEFPQWVAKSSVLWETVGMSKKRTKGDTAQRQADQLEKKFSRRPGGLSTEHRADAELCFSGWLVLCVDKGGSRLLLAGLALSFPPVLSCWVRHVLEEVPQSSARWPMQDSSFPFRVSFLVCCALALIVPTRAAAFQSNFLVDDTSDLWDADLSDRICRTQHQTCTLRAAVQQANAIAGASIIDLPAGDYALTIFGSDDIARRGDLDIRTRILLRGADARLTTVRSSVDDRVFHVLPGANAVISGVTVMGGNVDGNGGGIVNGGTLVLFATTIAGNYAFGDGGGIHNAGVLKILGSTITANRADNSGGGIANTSQMVITNSTIGENTVTAFGAEKGGGLRNVGFPAIARLTNVTLNGNSAAQGASITNDDGGRIRVKMTILATATDPNCLGIISSLGHNLDSGSTCGLDGPGDLSDTNPLLSTLSDNGGQTDTYALMSSSPAVDSGDAVGCPMFDQRGVARPQDGDSDGSAICDIGSYELNP
jgi:hypothetical protein